MKRYFKRRGSVGIVSLLLIAGIMISFLYIALFSSDHGVPSNKMISLVVWFIISVPLFIAAVILGIRSVEPKKIGSKIIRGGALLVIVAVFIFFIFFFKNL